MWFWRLESTPLFVILTVIPTERLIRFLLWLQLCVCYVIMHPRCLRNEFHWLLESFIAGFMPIYHTPQPANILSWRATCLKCTVLYHLCMLVGYFADTTPDCPNILSSWSMFCKRFHTCAVHRCSCVSCLFQMWRPRCLCSDWVLWKLTSCLILADMRNHMLWLKTTRISIDQRFPTLTYIEVCIYPRLFVYSHSVPFMQTRIFVVDWLVQFLGSSLHCDSRNANTAQAPCVVAFIDGVELCHMLLSLTTWLQAVRYSTSVMLS